MKWAGLKEEEEFVLYMQANIVEAFSLIYFASENYLFDNRYVSRRTDDRSMCKYLRREEETTTTTLTTTRVIRIDDVVATSHAY